MPKKSGFMATLRMRLSSQRPTIGQATHALNLNQAERRSGVVPIYRAPRVCGTIFADRDRGGRPEQGTAALSLEDEIATAIHSHERWKVRLGASIDDRNVAADVAEVGKDNTCAFGRWLYGSTIPKAALYDPNYIIVQFLHAKFHECAAQVVQLVTDGRHAEARAMLDHGDYAKISGQLTATMLKWRDSVQRNGADPRGRHRRP
jgi:hypothetical protein